MEFVNQLGTVLEVGRTEMQDALKVEVEELGLYFQGGTTGADDGTELEFVFVDFGHGIELRDSFSLSKAAFEVRLLLSAFAMLGTRETVEVFYFLGDFVDEIEGLFLG